MLGAEPGVSRAWPANRKMMTAAATTASAAADQGIIRVHRAGAAVLDEDPTGGAWVFANCRDDLVNLPWPAASGPVRQVCRLELSEADRRTGVVEQDGNKPTGVAPFGGFVAHPSGVYRMLRPQNNHGTGASQRRLNFA